MDNSVLSLLQLGGIAPPLFRVAEKVLSTKIYSMAGSDEQNPSASTDELIAMIKGAGKIPAERDTIYNIIRIFP